MTFVKACSVLVTLVLIFQTGCDLFCQRADTATSAAFGGDSAPPCHGASEQIPPHDDGSGHDDCSHPQAIAKKQSPANAAKFLRTSILETLLPMASVSLPNHMARFSTGALSSLPGHPFAVLRI